MQMEWRSDLQIIHQLSIQQFQMTEFSPQITQAEHQLNFNPWAASLEMVAGYSLVTI